MKVVVAETETLQGADLLDDSVRGVFEHITPADITGALAEDQGFGGGDEHTAWLRPAVGVEPAMCFSALVQMAGTWGGTQLVAPAEIFSLPDGGLVRLVFYTLTVTIGQVGIDPKVLRWRMEPGGDDATKRADALNLLDALHMGGVLTVSDERTNQVIQTVAVAPQELDRDLARARPFLERVCASRGVVRDAHPAARRCRCGRVCTGLPDRGGRASPRGSDGPLRPPNGQRPRRVGRRRRHRASLAARAAPDRPWR